MSKMALHNASSGKWTCRLPPGWSIPRAIYLHEGQQYFVQDLNLSRNIATLIPVALDYYTEPLRQTEVNLMTTFESSPLPWFI